MNTINIAGRPVAVSFEKCELHLQGEFASNLDLVMRIDAQISQRDMLANLRVRVPGCPALIDTSGWGNVDGGYSLTFFTELSPPGDPVPAARVPSRVEVLWLAADAERAIATVDVTTIDESLGLGLPERGLTPHAAVKSGCGGVLFLALMLGTAVGVANALLI